MAKLPAESSETLAVVRCWSNRKQRRAVKVPWSIPSANHLDATQRVGNELQIRRGMGAMVSIVHWREKLVVP